MLITDQVSTYLHIYRECLHKQSVRASALQITNQNCQLKVRALLSLEKMSIFYSNKWHIFTCVQSTVQCREMRCANESKNNTVYSTAAGGGGCSAIAAHQSKVQSTSVLRPAHLISLYTPDILRDECNVAKSVSCCS